MTGFLQIVIGGLLQGGVFAAVALGFSLVYRITGVINLSQGAFCVLGAMGMYFCAQLFGWPVPLAVPLAVAAATAFSVLVGATTFVPAVTRLPVSSTLMLTAGLLTFFEGVTLRIWGNQPYALPPFSGEAPIALGPLRIPTQGLWLAGGSALMIVALWYLLNRTRLGHALRACAENPMAARLMGIDVPRMTLLSFGLAAFIGAVSGILVAPITSLQFDSGRFFTNSGFIAVAIGGLGSFAGSIVGGLVVGVAEQLAAFYVSSLFANTLALLLLLAVLLLRPQGLFASGPLRRTDVREETRVHRPLIRLSGGRQIGFGLVLTAVLAVAADPAAAGRHAGVARHRPDPLYRRARTRRAHGLCRAGQSGPGGLHGDRRLCRRDPGDDLRLAAARRHARRHVSERRLRARTVARHQPPARSFTSRWRPSPSASSSIR